MSKEAEAFEMQQPEPTKLASLITSPSTLRNNFNWSPQSGLWPCAEQVACGIAWKFRGCLQWSRMTCW